MSDDDHREFLLQRLRQAMLQAKLMEAELASIGIALKNDMIDCDTAARWLHEQNLYWMVMPMPIDMTEILKEQTEDAVRVTGRSDAGTEQAA